MRAAGDAAGAGSGDAAGAAAGGAFGADGACCSALRVTLRPGGAVAALPLATECASPCTAGVGSRTKATRPKRDAL